MKRLLNLIVEVAAGFGLTISISELNQAVIHGIGLFVYGFIGTATVHFTRKFLNWLDEKDVKKSDENSAQGSAKKSGAKIASRLLGSDTEE